MSNAKKCDICGRFWIPGSISWEMRISKINHDDGIRTNDYYDICMDCLKNKIYPLIPSSEMLKEEFGNE